MGWHHFSSRLFLPGGRAVIGKSSAFFSMLRILAVGVAFLLCLAATRTAHLSAGGSHLPRRHLALRRHRHLASRSHRHLALRSWTARPLSCSWPGPLVFFRHSIFEHMGHFRRHFARRWLPFQHFTSSFLRFHNFYHPLGVLFTHHSLFNRKHQAFLHMLGAAAVGVAFSRRHTAARTAASHLFYHFRFFRRNQIVLFGKLKTFLLMFWQGAILVALSRSFASSRPACRCHNLSHRFHLLQIFARSQAVFLNKGKAFIGMAYILAVLFTFSQRFASARTLLFL